MEELQIIESGVKEKINEKEAVLKKL